MLAIAVWTSAPALTLIVNVNSVIEVLWRFHRHEKLDELEPLRATEAAAIALSNVATSTPPHVVAKRRKRTVAVKPSGLLD